MIGNLLDRLRVPCATADSKLAADEIERLTEALHSIAMCEQRYHGDLVWVARKALGMIPDKKAHTEVIRPCPTNALHSAVNCYAYNATSAHGLRSIADASLVARLKRPSGLRARLVLRRGMGWA